MGIHNVLLALAGPYGSGCTSLTQELSRVITDWPGCTAKTITVSALIECYYSKLIGTRALRNHSTASRRNVFQKAGTKLRKQFGNDFVGKMIALAAFSHGRLFESELANRDNSGRTVFYLIDSLKNVHDLTTLRNIYRDEVFLIFVHADKEARWQREKDYKSWKGSDKHLFEKYDAVDRDERAIDPSVGDSGQQVQSLASMADYYIVNDGNLKELQNLGKRFIHLLAGDTNNQPTFDENAMHLAFSASNRSFCLSRQVGAAIVDDNGGVVGIGWNDVPKINGGLYSQELPCDKRCYLVGDRRCINDVSKEKRFDGLLESLCSTIPQCGRETSKALKRALITSDFKKATEYCRAVHAEMEAILSASRSSGRSTMNSRMYVTTQPCHNCTKHIICAGIKHVVFIEPYPSSLAEELHSDTMVMSSEKAADPSHVAFSYYRGVAPRRFHDFFSLVGHRKTSEGKIVLKSKEELAKGRLFAFRIPNRSRLLIKKDMDPTTNREMLSIKEFLGKLKGVHINKRRERNK